MNVQDIKKVVCIGGGTIGASWATYFLWKGLDVTIQDITEEALERAKNLITSNIDFFVEKGIITEEMRQDIEKRAIYSTDFEEALTGAHFIQESVFESYEVKQNIINEMDKYAPEAIYSSSTSGLLITEIQKNSKYPERCVVGHPFNPPHLIPLVEIVKGEKTSEETVKIAYDFYKSIGKEPIICNKEVPGHIANRVQMALWREAADLVLNGVCSVKDVDLAVRYGPGLRWALMGPHLTWDLSSPNGIAGTLHHIGPSMESWMADMAEWKKIPENASEVLTEGLKEVTDHATPEELKAWRDDKLIEILKQVDKL